MTTESFHDEKPRSSHWVVAVAIVLIVLGLAISIGTGVNPGVAILAGP